MAVNEFEKNVQREMDEFKLRPSEEVWVKVEERIREKKRKRRILFFLLFPAIGLILTGYGIYYFSGNVSKPIIDNKLSEANKPVTNSTNKELMDGTIKLTTHDESIKPDKKIAIAERKNDTEESQEKIMIRNSVGFHKDHYDLAQTKSSLTIKNLKQVEAQKKQNSNNGIVETNVEKFSPVDRKPVSENTSQEIETKPVDETVMSNNSPDTVKTIQQESTKDAVVVESKKPTQKINHYKEIIWGVDISLGSSTITENPFSFDNSKSVADMQYTPAPSTGSGGQPINYHGPQSQNKSAFAFKVGLNVRKDLSPRSSLSMGVSYSYLADKIEVGAKQYTNPSQNQNNSFSSAFAYYTNVSSQQSSFSQSSSEYTNQFHFIELPVIYHWRMTNNPGHFLSLNAGISPAYLLSSNALVYDTAFGGIYYSDKSLIQKTHFNIVSGLSYQFGINKNLRFCVGPQFSFDLTKVFKSEFDERKYFLFTGINAGIFLDKKKK